jgi:hypothetical protein
MIKAFLRRVLPQRFRDSIAAYRLLRRIRAGRRAMLRERSRPPPWDFHILSQNGEDGIIDKLASDLKIQGASFVGVGFGPTESNLIYYAATTRAKGLFIDGSPDCCSTASRLFPKLGIVAKVLCAWIDRENINDLISLNLGNEVGILSIDLDGNDYWIWQSVTAINPILVIAEYNASFGTRRSVTTPYIRDFDRFRHHSSGSCHGMSLRAATSLAEGKGYSLVCTDLAGLNAFFVRSDRLTATLGPASVESAFHSNRYRTNERSTQEQQESIAFLGAIVEL